MQAGSAPLGRGPRDSRPGRVLCPPAGSVLGNLIISFKGRGRHPILPFEFCFTWNSGKKGQDSGPKASVCVGTPDPEQAGPFLARTQPGRLLAAGVQDLHGLGKGGAPPQAPASPLGGSSLLKEVDVSSSRSFLGDGSEEQGGQPSALGPGWRAAHSAFPGGGMMGSRSPSGSSPGLRSPWCLRLKRTLGTGGWGRRAPSSAQPWPSIPRGSTVGSGEGSGTFWQLRALTRGTLSDGG